MTYRVRNIVIAVGLAALAAALTSLYVSDYKKSVRTEASNVRVFVASKDIPAGTSGATAVTLLTPVHVTRRNVVPGAVSSREQVRSLVATDTVYAGEQVTTQRFRPVEQIGIRAQLKGNLRAIQVPGDANQLLAGTLKKGDRVDVVGTWNVPEDATHHVSRVILRDLKVLKPSDVSLASDKVGLGGGGSVQLLLTDSQASKLQWIVENGKWRLQLRAPAGAVDSAENLENYDTLMVDGVNKRQLDRVRPGAERNDS